MAVLSVRNLTVAYPEKIALQNISFEMEKPTMMAILGPNGAGKTTLLKTILGLLRPISGTIEILGMDPFEEGSKVRKMVGYVPQREKIDPTMPVLVKDVVLMGRTPKLPLGAWFGAKDIEIAREALSLVGMGDYWEEPYIHLSGGQQQRVLIARALASNPKFLLLDEPFAGIDLTSRSIILDVIRNKVEGGVGTIIVSHNPEPALIADLVLLLNVEVMAFGRKEDVLRPELIQRVYGMPVMLGLPSLSRDGDVHV